MFLFSCLPVGFLHIFRIPFWLIYGSFECLSLCSFQGGCSGLYDIINTCDWVTDRWCQHWVECGHLKSFSVPLSFLLLNIIVLSLWWCIRFVLFQLSNVSQKTHEGNDTSLYVCRFLVFPWFFLLDTSGLFSHFITVWRTSFSQSLRVGLLVRKSFHFPSFKNAFIPP